MSREELIDNAVAFLKDPQVAGASIDKKIEFLESKGLTRAEIDDALRRNDQTKTNSTPTAAAPATTVAPASTPETGYSTGYYPVAQPPPPALPERDWKDYFVMATTTVGVGYALYQITKRYVIPNILPESKTKLEQDKQGVEEEFVRIEATLKEIAQTNKELQEGELQKKKEVGAVVEALEEVIIETKTKNGKLAEDLRFLKAEVENLKNSFDKAVEKQQLAIGLEVATIQAELKSLQQLIKSKNSLTSEVMSNGNGNNNNTITSPVPSASSIPSASEILKKANIKTGGAGAGGSSTIPSWQQQQQQQSASTNSSSSDLSAPAPAPRPPVVKSTSIPAWQQLSSNATSASVVEAEKPLSSYVERSTVEIPQSHKFAVVSAAADEPLENSASAGYVERASVEIPESHKLVI